MKLTIEIDASQPADARKLRLLADALDTLASNDDAREPARPDRQPKFDRKNPKADRRRQGPTPVVAPTADELTGSNDHLRAGVLAVAQEKGHVKP